MKKHHLPIIILLFGLQTFAQPKSKVEIACESAIVFDSVLVENKSYQYKVIAKHFAKNKKSGGVGDVLLPQFNRKSDSVTLNKLMSKIGKLHKLRFLNVAQNCAVLKMCHSPFKPTPEEDKMIEEQFIGVFDLLTNKKVRHP